MRNQPLHRRSVRLPSRCYLTGSFFITFCTHKRVRMLGSISNGEVRLSELGEIVNREWERTPQVRPGVTLGEWIVMPDHFHAVVHLPDPLSTEEGPDRLGYPGKSLASLIGGFKAACTRQYLAKKGGNFRSMWQRSFYEHVIRSADELERIENYIRANPSRW